MPKRQVRFADVPGWAEDNHAAAFTAFRRAAPHALSLHAEAPEPDKPALAAVCRHALSRGGRITASGARAFFEHFFQPHALTEAPAGLLTGYYEPLIDGSLDRTERFSVPLYRRPRDLENVIGEAERARSDVPFTHMRRTPAGLEPFATRAGIDAGALDGQGLELIWLADRVEAFVVHIQGSARIRLPDGRRIGVAYDGKNGHPYTSVGRHLIDCGEMNAHEMTMESLTGYLRADPARGSRVMQRNESFVFFREMDETEGRDAIGALGAPLVAGRSLAVDTAHHVLGSPIFVDAPGIRHAGGRRAFRRLMIASDVGSAIRGMQRGDIYFGAGERAAARAGITKHSGRFIVLRPRGSGP